MKLGDKEFHPNLEIIGIDPELDIYEGYDGTFPDFGKLNHNQKIELANIMIERWQEYKEKEEKEYKRANIPTKEDHIKNFTEAILVLLKKEIPNWPSITSFDQAPRCAANTLQANDLRNNSWTGEWIDWWDIEFYVEDNELKFKGQFRSIYPSEHVPVEGSIKLRKTFTSKIYKVEVA